MNDSIGNSTPEPLRRRLLSAVAVGPLAGWLGLGGRAIAAPTGESGSQLDVAPARQEPLQLVGATAITCILDGTKPLVYNLPTLLGAKPFDKTPRAVWATVNFSDKPISRAANIGGLPDHAVFPFRNASMARLSFYKGYNKDKIPLRVVYPHPMESAVVPLDRSAPTRPDGSEPEPKPFAHPQDYFRQRLEGALGGYLITHRPVTPPPQLLFGTAVTGYRTLEEISHSLATEPDPVQWSISCDAPNYPKDHQPNESSILLLLARASRDTGRKALALLHPQARVAIEPNKKHEAMVEALRLALEAANVKGNDLGLLIHDGRRGSEYSALSGAVGRALHELAPDRADALTAEARSLPAFLGELGVSTWAYSLLLACFGAWWDNHPVLLVGGQEEGALQAIVVTPPTSHQKPDHHPTYYSAQMEGEFDRPWWGEWLDGHADFGMQRTGRRGQPHAIPTDFDDLFYKVPGNQDKRPK